MLQQGSRCQRGLLEMATRRQQSIQQLHRQMRFVSTRIPSSFTDRTTNIRHDSSQSINFNQQTKRWKSLAQQVAATNQKRNTPLANVRKQLWEFYFSTGRGASALFEVIDIKETGFLEPKEVQAFIREVLSYEENGKTVHVDPRDIMPYAWNILEKRDQENQNYDIRECLIS